MLFFHIIARAVFFAVTFPCAVLSSFWRLLTSCYLFVLLWLILSLLLVPSLVFVRYHHDFFGVAQRVYSCSAYPLLRDVVEPVVGSLRTVYEAVVPWWNFYVVVVRRMLWDSVILLLRCRGLPHMVKTIVASTVPLSRSVVLSVRIAASTVVGVRDDAMPYVVRLMMDMLADLASAVSCVMDCFCATLRYATDTAALVLRNPHLQCFVSNLFRFVQEILTSLARSLYMSVEWFSELFVWVSGAGNPPQIEPDKLPDVDRTLDVLIAGFCCAGDFVDDVFNSMLEVAWDLLNETLEGTVEFMPGDLRLGGLWRGTIPPVMEAVRLVWYAATGRFDAINETLIMDSLEHFAIEVADAAATFTGSAAGASKNAVLVLLRFARIVIDIAVRVRSYEQYIATDWGCMFGAWKNSTEDLGDFVDTFANLIPSPLEEEYNYTMFHGELGRLIRTAGSLPLETVAFAVNLSKSVGSFEDYGRLRTDCFFDVMTNLTVSSGDVATVLLDHVPVWLPLKLLDPELGIPSREITNLAVETANLLVETLRLVVRSTQHANFSEWRFRRGDTDLYHHAWRTWAAALGDLADHAREVAEVVGLEEFFENFGNLGNSSGLVLAESVALVVRTVLHPDAAKETVLGDVLCAVNNAAIEYELALQWLNARFEVPYWGNVSVNAASAARANALMILRMFGVLNSLAVEGIKALDLGTADAFNVSAVQHAIHTFADAVNSAVRESTVFLGAVDDSVPEMAVAYGRFATSLVRIVADVSANLAGEEGEYETIMKQLVCAAEAFSDGIGKSMSIPLVFYGKIATLLALAAGGEDAADRSQRFFDGLTLSTGRLVSSIADITAHVSYIVVESVPVLIGEKNFSDADWSYLRCWLNDIPYRFGDVIMALDFTGANATCELSELVTTTGLLLVAFPDMIIQLVDELRIPIFEFFVRVRMFVVSVGNLVAAAISEVCLLLGTLCYEMADSIGRTISSLMNVFMAMLEFAVRVVVRTAAAAVPEFAEVTDVESRIGPDYYSDFVFVVEAFQRLLRAVASLLNAISDGLGFILDVIADLLGAAFIDRDSPVAIIMRSLFNLVEKLLSLLFSIFRGGAAVQAAVREFTTAVLDFFREVWWILSKAVVGFIDQYIFGGARIGDYGIVDCLLHFGKCVLSVVFKRDGTVEEYADRQAEWAAAGRRLIDLSGSFADSDPCRGNLISVGNAMLSGNGSVPVWKKQSVFLCLSGTAEHRGRHRTTIRTEPCTDDCASRRMGEIIRTAGVSAVEYAWAIFDPTAAGNATEMGKRISAAAGADPDRSILAAETVLDALADTREALSNLSERCRLAGNISGTYDELMAIVRTAAAAGDPFRDLMLDLEERFVGMAGRVAAVRAGRPAQRSVSGRKIRWQGSAEPGCGHENALCDPGNIAACLLLEEFCPEGWPDCLGSRIEVPRPCPSYGTAGVPGKMCSRICQTSLDSAAFRRVCMYQPSIDVYSRTGDIEEDLQAIRFYNYDCQHTSIGGLPLYFCGRACAFADPDSVLNTGNWSETIKLPKAQYDLLVGLCAGMCWRSDPLCRRQSRALDCFRDKHTAAICDRYCTYERPTGVGEPSVYLPPEFCYAHDKSCMREYNTTGHPILHPRDVSTTCVSPVYCNKGAPGAVGEACEGYSDYYVTKWMLGWNGVPWADEQLPDLNVMEFFCPWRGDLGTSWSHFTFFNSPNYTGISGELGDDWCDVMCPGGNCTDVFHPNPLDCGDLRSRLNLTLVETARLKFCQLFPGSVDTIGLDDFPIRSPGTRTATNPDRTPIGGLQARSCPKPDGSWGNGWGGTVLYSCYMLAPGEKLHSPRPLNTTERAKITASMHWYHELLPMLPNWWFLSGGKRGARSATDAVRRTAVARSEYERVCHPSDVVCDYGEHEPRRCRLEDLMPDHPDTGGCGLYDCQRYPVSPCLRVLPYRLLPDDPYAEPPVEQPEDPIPPPVRRAGGREHAAGRFSSALRRISARGARGRAGRTNGTASYTCRADYPNRTVDTSVLPPLDSVARDCFAICGYNHSDLLDRSCLWYAANRTGGVADAVDFIVGLIPRFCEFVGLGNGSDYLLEDQFSEFGNLSIRATDPGPPDAVWGGEYRIVRLLKGAVLRSVWSVFGVRIRDFTAEQFAESAVSTVVGSDSGEMASSFFSLASNTNLDRRGNQSVGLLYIVLYPFTVDCFKLDVDWLYFPMWLPALPLRAAARFYRFVEWTITTEYLLSVPLVAARDGGCLNVSTFSLPYVETCPCDAVTFENCGRKYGFWSPLDSVAFVISWLFPAVHNSTAATVAARITLLDGWLDKFSSFHDTPDRRAYIECFFITAVPFVIIFLWTAVTLLTILILLVDPCAECTRFLSDVVAALMYSVQLSRAGPGRRPNSALAVQALHEYDPAAAYPGT